ncbi:MAG: tail fiber domain-containing protein [Marinilabiliaceae bacterium]|nr:tail fiber domain-containing protein [Marinilabiliaceae bacterium]
MKKLLIAMFYIAFCWQSFSQIVINNTNDVGIGISSPTHKLHVVGKSFLNGNVGLGVAADGNHRLKVSGTTLFSENVGIGDYNSDHKLNVVGKGYFSDNVGIGVAADGNHRLKVSGTTLFSENVGIGDYNSDHKLNVVGKGYFSDNVGIGVTASSSDKLHVLGSTLLQGNAYFLMDGPNRNFEIKNTPTNARLEIGMAESDRDFHRSSKIGDVVIRRLGNIGDHKKFIISTATYPHDLPSQAVGIVGADDENATGIWAHNNLNVRIGPYSTTAPTQMLEVEGNTYLTGSLGIGIARPAYKLHVADGDSYVDGNSYLTGNLGIGTTTPDYNLHVIGNSMITGNSFVDNSFVGGNSFVYGNSIFYGNVGISDGSPYMTHKFQVQGTTFLDGNVGVGTGAENTTNRLHVAGNTLITDGGLAVGGIGGIGGIGLPFPYMLNVEGVSRFATNLGALMFGNHSNGYSPSPGQHNLVAATLYPANNNVVFLGASDNRFNSLFVYTVNYHTLTNGSDIRLKENIHPLPPMLDKLKEVQAYNFNYTDEYFKDFSEEEKEYMQRVEYGFIAQEIQEIFPELVFERGEEKMLSLNYVSMIPILTAAINELREESGKRTKEVDDLRKESENRLSSIEDLRLEVETLKSMLAQCCTAGITKSKEENETSSINFQLSDDANTETEEMILYQNAPNPFDKNTTIRCFIPKGMGNVQLCVYNMQGAQVQCLDVYERGTVDVIIEAGKLTSGIYTYLLIGDAKTSDAKQMILTK